MRFEHEVFIAAPADEMWRLNTDIESWPAMSPTFVSVERLDDGPLRVGSTARVKQPGQRATTWTVTAVDPPRRFEWEASVLGVHMVATHEVVAVEGGCRNRLTLTMSGLRGRALGSVAGRLMQRSLATENEGFKRHAEAAAA
jgi:uncharacterized membrane protein